MHRMIRIAASAALALLLTACGLTQSQIVKTQSFGAATASIGEFGEAEFMAIRKEIIAMNSARLALGNKSLPKKLRLDRGAGVEATSVRVNASRSIRLYGELLVQLVGHDSSDNLRGVANGLIDSTSAALKRELAEKPQRALSGIAAGLGSLWLDQKRADALREIVPAYHDSLNELADLLGKDFALGGYGLGFLKAYENAAKSLKNSALRLLNKGGEHTALEREQAVQGLLMADKALSRATEIGERASEAVEALKRANGELLAVVQGGDYSPDGIRGYAQQIQELASVRRVLSH